MPVQGGNSIDHGFAYAGMVVDNQVENAISKLNKSDTVVIPAGVGVVTDGEDGAAIPTDTATAANFNGIVKRELNRAVLDGDTSGDNRQRDMTIVTHGVVYAQTIGTIAKDDNVYLVVGDGTTPNANLGLFTNATGTGVTAAVQITDAKFVSADFQNPDGQLAKISFGLGG